MSAPIEGPKRIENLLDCPPDPRCVVARRSPPTVGARFPEGFSDRERLAAHGWLYCVVCNCAVLR